jgi:hypothetical protein
VQRLDFGDFRIERAGAGELAGQAFQRAHHFEGVLDLGHRHLRHDRAAVRLQHDQALDRQRLERFAQRRARDVQLFAQHALVEPGAGGQHPFDDHLAQARTHGRGQAQAVDTGNNRWGCRIIHMQRIVYQIQSG